MSPMPYNYRMTPTEPSWLQMKDSSKRPGAAPYDSRPELARRGSDTGNRWSPTGYEILTRSGAMIDIRAPRPEQIKLSDISIGLANDYRFAGQCPLRPTVAQHSLAVERIAVELARRSMLRAADVDYGALSRAALLHDAAEAYINDLTGAVKLFMRQDGWGGYDDSPFDEIEDAWMRAIQHRFEFSFEGWSHAVHEADCIACAYEMAYDGWCAEAKPPEWAADLVRGCYGTRGFGGQHTFVARARQLGIED